MLTRAQFLRLAALGLGTAALGGCASVSPRELDAAPRRILVPAAVGGGYDTTARTAAAVMAAEGITPTQLEVFAVPGGGGLVGLTRALGERGRGSVAMLMGLGVVGAGVAAGRSDDVLSLTPIARLAEEPGVLLADATTGFDSVHSALATWRAAPRTVRVGIGSSRGGPDHLFALQVRQAVGIRRDDAVFAEFSGGGELLSALLTGRIDLAFGGAGETGSQIAAGAVRALAVSSAERLAAIDAPTLREAGVDLVFRNWRGLAAPPGIPDADRQRWADDVARMHATAAWRAALAENGWIDAYLPGEEFADLIRSQRGLVADVLREDT
ncbi:Bug family tripartite tricarboxylate transporter substrate binding protein [Microbacterium sp. NPDC091313]